MKVLFVHDGPIYKDEQNNYYGIHYNDSLIRRYLQLGTHVTFLGRVNDINILDIKKYSLITHKNFDVIEVPNFKSFFKYFSLRPKAKKIIEKAILDYDIIMARLPSGSGNIAVHYAQKHNKPLLTEMVACTLDAYWYHSFKGKLIAHYFFLKQKRIMKNLEYCIYVTKFFLQSRYRIKGKSINCSNVEIGQLDIEILKKRLLKINQKDVNAPIILGSIGTLSIPYKGHDNVIKALAILKDKEGCRFIYKLVGQGSTSRLEHLIKKNNLINEVIILGTLKHNQIFNFIDTIDIYIHPSRTEGLPRAPIEAMSRACPVIGSDAGGTPELIAKDFIYEKSSISQIVNLLSNINKNKLLTESNRSFSVAKEYQKEILDMRRKTFYNLFLKEKLNGSKI